MDGTLLVDIGLFGILLVVLAGPFRSKLVERNLEIFLLGCGIIALTISGFASIEGYTFGWTAGVLTAALTAPAPDHNRVRDPGRYRADCPGFRTVPVYIF